MKVPKGVINFDLFKCECIRLDSNSKQNNCKNDTLFQIKIQGVYFRHFIFRASSAEECTQWINEIDKHIKHSEGFLLNKSVQGNYNPWRYDNLSEKQFLEVADTGDILLFQTGTKTGNFIRKITGGSFDHVAMILRFESEDDEVFFVEASGNYGVALNKWSSVRKHVGKDKFYERLVYRRVNFDRDDEMVDCLEVFLREAVGQSYGLNIKKLLMRKTVGFNPLEIG